MKNQKPLRKFLNSLGFKVEGSKLFSKNNMPVDSFNVNDYFWLDGNFYLLTLPRPFGKEKLEEWEIEQLFTDETLNHKIKGRSFRLAPNKMMGRFMINILLLIMSIKIMRILISAVLRNFLK